MFKVYMESPSMRYAAKKLGIDMWKLRRVRDLLNWPKKSTSLVRANGLEKRKLDGPRAVGRSIYDSIESG